MLASIVEIRIRDAKVSVSKLYLSLRISMDTASGVPCIRTEIIFSKFVTSKKDAIINAIIGRKIILNKLSLRALRKLLYFLP